MVKAVKNKYMIKGKSLRFRLCVYRSAKHIYAQIIDDTRGITICSASSLASKDNHFPPDSASQLVGKVRQASEVGRQIAQKAKQLGVVKVFFDRNGYKYHGRVRQLAESARLEGLSF